jgi:hypothetical protein
MARIFLSLRNPEVPDARDVPGSGEDFIRAVFHANVEVECLVCGKPHDKLWTVVRRTTAWGPWPVAQISERDERGRFGSKTVIDPSLPTTVTFLPKDAVEVSPEDAARVWHEDNESHVFGGPNVAKALRESIAQANKEVTR